MNNQDIQKIANKVKGLSDLLWSVAVQSETGDCLRTEGLMALASLASDIEHDIETCATDV